VAELRIYQTPQFHAWKRPHQSFDPTPSDPAATNSTHSVTLVLAHDSHHTREVQQAMLLGDAPARISNLMLACRNLVKSGAWSWLAIVTDLQL